VTTPNVRDFRNARFFRTPKAKIVLGPWTGGLNRNRLGTPSLLSPNELQECINFTPQASGQLVTRPSISATPNLSYGNSKIIGTTLDGSGRVVPVISYNDGTNDKMAQYQIGTGWVAFSGVLANTFDIQQLIKYGTTYYLYVNFASGDFRNRLFSFLYPESSTAPTEIAAFGSSVSSALFTGALAANPTILILKDRMLLVADNAVVWSKATDPSVWAAPDGGYVRFNGDARSAYVFQDAVYIFGLAGIWRFSWTSDPNADGVFEQLNTTPVYSSFMYNNEMYVGTSMGVYKYVNGYFIELSDSIATELQTRLTQLVSGNFSYPTLVRLDRLLLFGPFTVTSGAAKNINAHQYYVYDLHLGVWTEWQVSADSRTTTDTVYGPRSDSRFIVGGQSILGANLDTFWWSTNGVVHSMKNTFSTGDSYDVTPSNNKIWIGQKFTTAEVDLGDGLVWKRVFKSLLEGIYTAVTFTSGNSLFNLILDGISVPLTPPDSGKLSWGKSYRAKRVSFQYDSISNTQTNPASAVTTELSFISRVTLHIAGSREVTT